MIRGRDRFIKPIIDSGQYEVIVEEDWDDYNIERHQPDIVLSVGESNYDIIKCFKKAKSLKIPTLNIQDGIHEWRDIWENDYYARGGNYFNRQFIIADKIACLGQLQADWYNAMGMTGQPEVIGMPWLEQFIQNTNKWKPRQGVKNVLVMTANTPAFDADQYATVLQSIKDIKEIFESYKNINPIWRVRGNLAQDLNLINDDKKFDKETLHKILPEVDCVISTPSTAIIESMIAGVPTALLDYSNSPSYINVAWRMNCKIQIENFLSELLEPPDNKLNFQQMALNLMVCLKTGSDKRLLNLIYKMISFGEISRREAIPLVMPRIILDDDTVSIQFPEFNKKSLFPYHSVFHKDDLLSLQIENNNLIIENKHLRNKLEANSLYCGIKRFIKRAFRIS